MDGIRQVLCVMTLLAYNLIVCYVLSHQEGDIEFCDNVLSKQLKVFICGKQLHHEMNGIKYIIVVYGLGVSEGSVVPILQRSSRIYER